MQTIQTNNLDVFPILQFDDLESEWNKPSQSSLLCALELVSVKRPFFGMLLSVGNPYNWALIVEPSIKFDESAVGALVPIGFQERIPTDSVELIYCLQYRCSARQLR